MRMPAELNSMYIKFCSISIYNKCPNYFLAKKSSLTFDTSFFALSCHFTVFKQFYLSLIFVLGSDEGGKELRQRTCKSYNNIR